jgi:hypothetical protein
MTTGLWLLAIYQVSGVSVQVSAKERRRTENGMRRAIFGLQALPFALCAMRYAAFP